jgi:hypothetical protein
MRDKNTQDQNGPVSDAAFLPKREPATEYEKAQETLRENYERLKADRLAREAARLKEQRAIT